MPSKDKKAYAKRYYQKHKEKQKVYAKNYYRKNRERRRQYYQEHKEALNNYHQEWRHQLKLEVFSYYSGGILGCRCCGETDIVVLCLDHINGGGTRERRETRRLGVGLYSWLKTHNFPDGYQVLCANCNMRKAMKERNAEWR